MLDHLKNVQLAKAIHHAPTLTQNFQVTLPCAFDALTHFKAWLVYTGVGEHHE